MYTCTYDSYLDLQAARNDFPPMPRRGGGGEEEGGGREECIVMCLHVS